MTSVVEQTAEVFPLPTVVPVTKCRLPMSREGQWRVSLAFDLAYAYDPQGAWTGRHQMRRNLKLDHFVLEYLLL